MGDLAGHDRGWHNAPASLSHVLRSCHLHWLLVRLPQQLSWHQSSSTLSHVRAPAEGCAVKSYHMQLYEGLLMEGCLQTAWR